VRVPCQRPLVFHPPAYLPPRQRPEQPGKKSPTAASTAIRKSAAFGAWLHAGSMLAVRDYGPYDCIASTQVASRRHHVRIIVATAESTIVLEKRLDHLHWTGWRSRQASSGQSLSKAHLGVVSAIGNGLLTTSLGFSPMRLDDALQRRSKNTISASKNFCARKRNVPGRHTKPPGRLQY
jgi:hypothetical protein